MKLKINLQSIEWWYWLLTLIAMIAGLLGVKAGFYVVITVSTVRLERNVLLSSKNQKFSQQFQRKLSLGLCR